MQSRVFGGLQPQPEQRCLTIPDRRVLSCLQGSSNMETLQSPGPLLSQFIPVPSAICLSTVAFPWHSRQEPESHTLHLCKVLWLCFTVCFLSSAACI